jgi:hypothetical protein
MKKKKKEKRNEERRKKEMGQESDLPFLNCLGNFYLFRWNLSSFRTLWSTEAPLLVPMD